MFILNWYVTKNFLATFAMSIVVLTFAMTGANLMKVIEHVWLGGGEKARKLLGVRGTPTGVTAKVEIDGAALTFEDLRLVQNDNNLV